MNSNCEQITLDTLALSDWREECAIIRIEQGNGIIYIDGDSYVACRGDYFFLRPFVIYSLHNDGEPLTVKSFVFNARSLARNCETNYNINDYLHFINEKNVPCAIKTTTEWYASFDEHASILFADCDDTTKTKQLYKSLSTLYNNRFASAELNLTEEKQRYTAKTMLTIVKTDYTQTISVKQVAATVDYDEFYTMKLFKKFTGLPLVEYVNRYRIALAREELVTTNKAINIIAREAGFANISYFNRQFKRLLGVTPAIFRLTEQKKTLNVKKSF